MALPHSRRLAGQPAPIPLTGGAWTLIGPQPVTGAANVGGNPAVSGRVAGLAADPTNANIIYMAAAGGGVWKTTDAGVTWKPADRQPEPPCSWAPSPSRPSNPNIIYAGTGEATNSSDSYYGRGVLKSSDGGATWTLENDNGAFDPSTISRIAVSPTDPNTLYVAVSNQASTATADVVTGVYKSTDGGATWTNTTTAIANVNPGNQFSDVVIDPANANNPILRHRRPRRIGGQRRLRVRQRRRHLGRLGQLLRPRRATTASSKLAISASNPADLIASTADATNQGLAFVATTTNGGTTWTNVTPGVNYMGTARASTTSRSPSIPPTP